MLDTPVKDGQAVSMPETTPTVTIAGCADILGVSRQQAHAISKLAEFPEPVLVTELGRRWDRRAVEEYVAKRKTSAS